MLNYLILTIQIIKKKNWSSYADFFYRKLFLANVFDAKTSLMSNYKTIFATTKQKLNYITSKINPAIWIDVLNYLYRVE